MVSSCTAELNSQLRNETRPVVRDQFDFSRASATGASSCECTEKGYVV